MTSLVEIITSSDQAVRDTPLQQAVASLSANELIDNASQLDRLSRESRNLYHRVRALMFLASIHRFHLPGQLPVDNSGLIPFAAYEHILERRFRESIDELLVLLESEGPNDALCSALASAYHQLAFQTLADQVRQSVRTVTGNQWMFRIGHPDDHPLRMCSELTRRQDSGAFPILKEETSVRMDFSHSGWSDIFFLGMDYPEGARVLNASINLGVHGRDEKPSPPIETYLRVIDEPVLRLVSVDLNTHADVKSVSEVFDFARDYLGLIKAAVIAAGIVPPGMEGCDLPIESVLSRVVGPGLGLEIVSKVNDIPKGSRLAVSTNLLGSLISVCMRATGQVQRLAGGLVESERRLVAARAILGEWIGGSGGGWQDSGGVWPGIKLIEGALATEGDPEFGISKGCLLPQHTVFGDDEISAATRDKLQASLVLVHGGMAQNVGPVLEMVTERYLLRSPKEWEARQETNKLLEDIIAALKAGDIPAVGKATHENFFRQLQTIIPWCTNLYTNLLVVQAQEKFGDQFHGFWMLGGMAGGGMGFIFDPSVKQDAQAWLQEAMLATKDRLKHSLPFAMDPVVYDFEINDRGSWCELLEGGVAQMPPAYYALMAPDWLRLESRELSPLIRHELESLGESVRRRESSGQALLERMLPERPKGEQRQHNLEQLLQQWGFDREQHEQVRRDLIEGRIGLAQNRLPATTVIEDVREGDVVDTRGGIEQQYIEIGEQAIRNGMVAVVTLAAGAGSRWTQGAGVVKALNPFCEFDGVHRSFLEVHIAKSRHSSQQYAANIPHVFTTSYLTDAPIREHLRIHNNHGYEGPLFVSTGKSVGLRMVPMIRDLRFAWEEMAQQVLDEQQQKMRGSVRSALINWAISQGEASDYTDNLPLQCMHPVGHWYEVPNLLRSGTLQELLQQQPSVKYLLLHNIDTLGATVDPGLLGLHIAGDAQLTIEVIQRRLQDHGGGLARVNDRVQLLEGLASPREADEFKLRFYNSMTTWIDIDQTLVYFGLSRDSISDPVAVDSAITRAATAMKTYVTIKEVKKRWGRGQEDIFPVIQFERLWGDMTALPSVSTQFAAVPLIRGQQLKEPADLDGWMLDGSMASINNQAKW